MHATNNRATSHFALLHFFASTHTTISRTCITLLRMYREDTSKSQLSIIIPAFNEERCILATLTYLSSCLEPPPHEILVVDGGSTDRTYHLVREFISQGGGRGINIRVLKSPHKGRAAQQNFGASKSSKKKGDLLLFLHADTLPPRDVVTLVRGALSERRTVLGGFVSLLTTPSKTW